LTKDESSGQKVNLKTDRHRMCKKPAKPEKNKEIEDERSDEKISGGGVHLYIFLVIFMSITTFFQIFSRLKKAD
jgi:hypothetical protein